MNIFLLRRIFQFLLIFFVICNFSPLYSQVVVTPANMLTLCPGGGYQTLSDIHIDGSKGDFNNGTDVTYFISVPNSSFEFNPLSPVTVNLTSSKNAVLSNLSVVITTSTVQLTYTISGIKGNGETESLIIGGIQVKAVGASSGNLIRTVGGLFDDIQPGNSPLDLQNHGTLITGNSLKIFNVTGGGQYCAGTSGLPVGLDGSESAVNYNLYRGSISPANLVVSIGGTGSAINFGIQTAGNYVVEATTGVSCTKTMNGSANVSLSPAINIYDLQSATNTYCQGDPGVVLTLSNSDVGINYTLYESDVNVITTIAGSGSSINFGIRPAGSYTVVAKNSDNCTQAMNGKLIIKSTIPAADRTLLGGTYCSGQNGAQVKMVAPQLGYGYSLQRTSDNVIVSTQFISGTVAPDTLFFGNQLVGTYQVIAFDLNNNTCSRVLSGTASVISYLINSYNLTAPSFSYCTGSPGVKLTLSNSDNGFIYNLYNGATLIQSYPGTGAALDLGTRLAGTYSVKSFAGSCSYPMNGTITLTANPPPSDRTIIGGSYCNGQSGYNVKLVSPQIGYGYNLYRTSDNVIVSSQTVPGPSLPDTIYFGSQPAGTYKMIAFDLNNYSCSVNLSGTATVTAVPTGTAPTLSASAPAVCSGANTLLTAGGTPYPSYIWYVDGNIISGAVTNSYSTNVSGFYQVQGVNSGCSSPFSTGKNIVTGSLPAAPVLTPSSNIICQGQNYILKAASAEAVNYEFYLNGTLPGNQIQSSSYPELNTTTLPAGNLILYARIQNGQGCFSSFSQVPLSVKAAPGPVSLIKDIASNNICQKQLVTFTASSAGASGYDFYVNNLLVYSGGNIYKTDSLSLGADQIYVVAKNAGNCTVTSSIINMNVGLSPKSNLASFPINSLICQGSITQIKIIKSQSGVNYSLFDSTKTQIGLTTGGTGGDIVIQTDKLYKSTTFSILASNPLTNCADTLDTKPTVGVNVTATVNASSPQSVICEGDTVQLFGSIGGAATYASWSSSGLKGRFIFKANSLDALYIPGDDDISSGNVILTLTTNDPDGPGECLAIAVDIKIKINKKPAVFFSFASADNYCIDASPVDLTNFVSTQGGTFSGKGVTGNNFDPSVAGPGTHTLNYALTDMATGCTNLSAADIIVNKLPDIDFSGLSPSYCKDTSNQVIKLIPINDDPNGTGVFYGFLGLSIDGKFIPGVLDPGIYTINYKFTNSKNCTNIISKKVKISPLPVAGFTVQNFCVGKKVVFKDISTVDNTLGNKITQWFWDFGDGDPTGNTLQNPTKFYALTGTYPVSLTVSTDDGCRNTFTSSVTIGEIATPNFTWSGGCEGGPTYFEGKADGLVTTWKWDFGDPSSGNLDTLSGMNAFHQYATPGEYFVRLRIGTAEGCINDVVKKVYVLPYKVITSNAQYFEGFEQGKGGWVADNLQQDTLYSWKLKNPSGSIINKAYQGTSAWVTDYKSDSSYLPNENSYVYSPCFNITGLKKPIISLYIFNSTEISRDGAVLQVSTDGGKTWKRLGDINSGLNWFNTGPILSNPGQQPAGEGAVGWSGTDSLWKRAVYNLDDYLIYPSVRFRLAFSSNGDNILTRPFDGFAFDNVSITERDHIVFLEHFTNITNAENVSENNFITSIVNNSNDEAIAVQYHTNFPVPNDPFYLANPNDLSARALYYGIPSTPRTVVDGNTFNTKLSTQPGGVNFYKTQKLNVPEFKINLQLTPGPNNSIKINADIKSTSDNNDSVWVQFLLIEKNINKDGINYRNVVRKIFPDVTGIKLFKQWTTGNLITLPTQNLILNNNFISDPSQVAVVMVVQNYISKEVYQCAYAEPNFTPDIISGIENFEETGISVFPNPADEELKIKIAGRLGKTNWVIFDPLGKERLNGTFIQGEENNLINTRALSAGNYVLKIMGNNNFSKAISIIIIH